MVWRAEIAQPGMRIIPDVLRQGRAEARFADPGLAGNQHHLPLAGFRLPPTPKQQLEFCRPSRVTARENMDQPSLFRLPDCRLPPMPRTITGAPYYRRTSIFAHSGDVGDCRSVAIRPAHAGTSAMQVSKIRLGLGTAAATDCYCVNSDCVELVLLGDSDDYETGKEKIHEHVHVPLVDKSHDVLATKLKPLIGSERLWDRGTQEWPSACRKTRLCSKSRHSKSHHLRLEIVDVDRRAIARGHEGRWHRADVGGTLQTANKFD